MVCVCVCLFSKERERESARTETAFILSLQASDTTRMADDGGTELLIKLSFKLSWGFGTVLGA